MPTLDSINAIVDHYKALIYVISVLALFGFGVVTPNLRLDKLEAQQVSDHKALTATTQYLRILATAQCLKEVEGAPSTDLMKYLCARVLTDQDNLRLP